MKNKLWRLTLDTNPEDCNLNCIMCEEHSMYSSFKEELFVNTGKKHRRMPKDWIEPIFKEAKKLGVQEIIPSTMGEPLLYKHIDLFFELAMKYDIKINLTTNGTFPGKTVEEWAKMIIPATSDTKISLNGATKETAEKIMTGLNFEKHVQDIREFTAFRNSHFNDTGNFSSITLQLTFLQNNMHELTEIIKLASELDIDRIKGHHLWTHFKEIENLSFKKNQKSIEKWNKIVDSAKKAIEIYKKPNGTKILLEQIEYLNRNEPKEVPNEYECPFLEKELWISATGKISPCCAPDKQRNSLGDFGNYSDSSISKVLNSEIYLDLVKNYKSKELCRTCVMRKSI
ncbi:MAG: radical SAM/SPASM domain-containing protein [Bacteroidota bacterium]|nr:radical SAM/SPASM domain-containing protein [Bacteroidota bacterium]